MKSEHQILWGKMLVASRTNAKGLNDDEWRTSKTGTLCEAAVVLSTDGDNIVIGVPTKEDVDYLNSRALKLISRKIRGMVPPPRELTIEFKVKEV